MVATPSTLRSAFPPGVGYEHRRSVKRFLAHGLLFVLGTAVVLEMFFRFVLPACDWPKGVILGSGIRRFDSGSFTRGRFTYGRYCRGGFEWSINGQGWNSVYEYETAEERDAPMAAILGDSYLEGFYSDVDEHIDVHLTEMFDDSVCFYTFAMSGGMLSQYVALMRYEVEQYSPDAYIVFVNASDIASSFRESGGTHPYFFQYSEAAPGCYVEERPDARTRNFLKNLILRSAFVRYLRGNALVPIFGGGLADGNAELERPGNGPVPEDQPSPRIAAETEFLLDELSSFGRPVLIVADCPRSWIYEHGDEEVFDDVIALREAVEGYPGIRLVELSGYYSEAFARDGRWFSLLDNPHWDAYANRVIAEAVYPSLRDLF